LKGAEGEEAETGGGGRGRVRLGIGGGVFNQGKGKMGKKRGKKKVGRGTSGGLGSLLF